MSGLSVLTFRQLSEISDELINLVTRWRQKWYEILSSWKNIQGTPVKPNEKSPEVEKGSPG